MMDKPWVRVSSESPGYTVAVRAGGLGTDFLDPPPPSPAQPSEYRAAIP